MNSAEKSGHDDPDNAGAIRQTGHNTTNDDDSGAGDDRELFSGLLGNGEEDAL